MDNIHYKETNEFKKLCEECVNKIDKVKILRQEVSRREEEVSRRKKEVKKANLEDVFISLTGKEWRDD